MRGRVAMVLLTVVFESAIFALFCYGLEGYIYIDVRLIAVDRKEGVWRKGGRARGRGGEGLRNCTAFLYLAVPTFRADSGADFQLVCETWHWGSSERK